MGASEIKDSRFAVSYRFIGVLVQQTHLVARQHAADRPAAKIFGILHPTARNRPHVLGAQIAGNIGAESGFGFFGDLGGEITARGTDKAQGA